MSAPPIQYFIRAWNVTVTKQDGTMLSIYSGQPGTDLRVEFDVDTQFGIAYWNAEVRLYNLAAPTQQQLQSGTNVTGVVSGQQQSNTNSNLLNFAPLLKTADFVTISAGYQYTSSGVFTAQNNFIYGGPILQTIWLRENVVDFKLVIRCTSGLINDAFNNVALSPSAGEDAFTTLNNALGAAQIPLANIDSGSQQALSAAKFPRGQVLFNRPYSIIAEIMKQNNLFFWFTNKGLNVRQFPTNALPTAQYIIGPPNLGGSYTQGSYQQAVKQTLIGTPQQTQLGVMFRTLLDAQIKIGDVFQLAPGTIINAVPIQVGQLPPIPNQTGLYIVSGVRHAGDSRGKGDDWFTEVTAVNLNFFQANNNARSTAGTGNQ